MRLSEYLSNISKDELSKRLTLLDKSIMELHQNNLYVVSDMSLIDIIDNEVTLASFKNKVDYIKQEGGGFNPNGDKQDILELCAIGVCAFNKFENFYTNKEFISYLIDNLDMFLENGSIPKRFQEYYIDVFSRGHVDYLNNFMLKYEDKAGNNNSLVYTKSTAVGRAFANKDEAFARILVLPALLALVILIVIVVYFVGFRG